MQYRHLSAAEMGEAEMEKMAPPRELKTSHHRKKSLMGVGDSKRRETIPSYRMFKKEEGKS